MKIKTNLAFFIFGLVAYLPAFASEGDAIKVCGVVYESSNGVKGIADKSVMTSYELVIDEVAEPKGQTLKLINYESEAFRALSSGQKICAVGIQGSSQDTRYPTVHLIQWAIISE